MKRDFFSSFPLFCGFFTVDFKISCEFKYTIVKFGAIPVISMRNEKNQRESQLDLGIRFRHDDDGPSMMDHQ